MSDTKSPTKIAVISMSTRTPRVGPKVAAVVKDIISRDPDASSYDISLVDVADFKLPVYDETVIPATVPAQAQFSHEHTKRWTGEIAKHDAYVFVFPEYNYGMSGGSKNAIDYLYNEWIGKPVVVVSYGIGGGNLASAAAKQTLEGMKLKVAETRPALAFAGGFGPDTQAAMVGDLGEESRKKWEGEQAPDILKAFGELKALLVAQV